MSQNLKKGQRSASSAESAKRVQLASTTFSDTDSTFSQFLLSVTQGKLNPTLSNIMSSFSKRDSQLCFDGLLKLKSLIPDLNDNDITELLPHWTLHFNQLSLSNKINIRDEMCKVHQIILQKVGKKFAQYLPQIICWWFILMNDLNNDVQKSALKSFEVIFSSPEKQIIVLSKFHDEIINHIISIISNGVKGVSEEKEMNEISEERFGRIASSCIRGGGTLIERYYKHEKLIERENELKNNQQKERKVDSIQSEIETKDKSVVSVSLKQTSYSVSCSIFGDPEIYQTKADQQLEQNISDNIKSKKKSNQSTSQYNSSQYSKPHISLLHLIHDKIPAVRQSCYQTIASLARFSHQYFMEIVMGQEDGIEQSEDSFPSISKQILLSFREPSPITFRSLFDMILICLNQYMDLDDDYYNNKREQNEQLNININSSRQQRCFRMLLSQDPFRTEFVLQLSQFLKQKCVKSPQLCYSCIMPLLGTLLMEPNKNKKDKGIILNEKERLVQQKLNEQQHLIPVLTEFDIRTILRALWEDGVGESFELIFRLVCEGREVIQIGEKEREKIIRELIMKEKDKDMNQDINEKQIQKGNNKGKDKDKKDKKSKQQNIGQQSSSNYSIPYQTAIPLRLLGDFLSLFALEAIKTTNNNNFNNSQQQRKLKERNSNQNTNNSYPINVISTILAKSVVGCTSGLKRRIERLEKEQKQENQEEKDQLNENQRVIQQRAQFINEVQEQWKRAGEILAQLFTSSSQQSSSLFPPISYIIQSIINQYKVYSNKQKDNYTQKMNDQQKIKKDQVNQQDIIDGNEQLSSFNKEQIQEQQIFKAIMASLLTPIVEASLISSSSSTQSSSIQQQYHFSIISPDIPSSISSFLSQQPQQQNNDQILSLLSQSSKIEPKTSNQTLFRTLCVLFDSVGLNMKAEEEGEQKIGKQIEGQQSNEEIKQFNPQYSSLPFSIPLIDTALWNIWNKYAEEKRMKIINERESKYKEIQKERKEKEQIVNAKEKEEENEVKQEEYEDYYNISSTHHQSIQQLQIQQEEIDNNLRQSFYSTEERDIDQLVVLMRGFILPIIRYELKKIQKIKGENKQDKKIDKNKKIKQDELKQVEEEEEEKESDEEEEQNEDNEEEQDDDDEEQDEKSEVEKEEENKQNNNEEILNRDEFNVNDDDINLSQQVLYIASAVLGKCMKRMMKIEMMIIQRNNESNNIMNENDKLFSVQQVWQSLLSSEGLGLNENIDAVKQSSSESQQQSHSHIIQYQLHSLLLIMSFFIGRRNENRLQSIEQRKREQLIQLANQKVKIEQEQKNDDNSCILDYITFSRTSFSSISFVIATDIINIQSQENQLNQPYIINFQSQTLDDVALLLFKIILGTNTYKKEYDFEQGEQDDELEDERKQSKKLNLKQLNNKQQLNKTEHKQLMLYCKGFVKRMNILTEMSKQVENEEVIIKDDKQQQQQSSLSSSSNSSQISVTLSALSQLPHISLFSQTAKENATALLSLLFKIDEKIKDEKEEEKEIERKEVQRQFNSVLSSQFYSNMIQLLIKYIGTQLLQSQSQQKLGNFVSILASVLPIIRKNKNRQIYSNKVEVNELQNNQNEIKQKLTISDNDVLNAYLFASLFTIDPDYTQIQQNSSSQQQSSQQQQQQQSQYYPIQQKYKQIWDGTCGDVGKRQELIIQLLQISMRDVNNNQQQQDKQNEGQNNEQQQLNYSPLIAFILARITISFIYGQIGTCWFDQVYLQYINYEKENIKNEIQNLHDEKKNNIEQKENIQNNIKQIEYLIHYLNNKEVQTIEQNQNNNEIQQINELFDMLISREQQGKIRTVKEYERINENDSNIHNNININLYSSPISFSSFLINKLNFITPQLLTYLSSLLSSMNKQQTDIFDSNSLMQMILFMHSPIKNDKQQIQQLNPWEQINNQLFVPSLNTASLLLSSQSQYSTQSSSFTLLAHSLTLSFTFAQIIQCSQFIYIGRRKEQLIINKEKDQHEEQRNEKNDWINIINDQIIGSSSQQIQTQQTQSSQQIQSQQSQSSQLIQPQQIQSSQFSLLYLPFRHLISLSVIISDINSTSSLNQRLTEYESNDDNEIEEKYNDYFEEEKEQDQEKESKELKYDYFRYKNLESSIQRILRNINNDVLKTTNQSQTLQQPSSSQQYSLTEQQQAKFASIFLKELSLTSKLIFNKQQTQHSSQSQSIQSSSQLNFIPLNITPMQFVTISSSVLSFIIQQVPNSQYLLNGIIDEYEREVRQSELKGEKEINIICTDINVRVAYSAVILSSLFNTNKSKQDETLKLIPLNQTDNENQLNENENKEEIIQQNLYKKLESKQQLLKLFDLSLFKYSNNSTKRHFSEFFYLINSFTLNKQVQECIDEITGKDNNTKIINENSQTQYNQQQIQLFTHSFTLISKLINLQTKTTSFSPTSQYQFPSPFFTQPVSQLLDSLTSYIYNPSSLFICELIVKVIDQYNKQQKTINDELKQEQQSSSQIIDHIQSDLYSLSQLLLSILQFFISILKKQMKIKELIKREERKKKIKDKENLKDQIDQKNVQDQIQLTSSSSSSSSSSSYSSLYSLSSQLLPLWLWESVDKLISFTHTNIHQILCYIIYYQQIVLINKINNKVEQKMEEEDEKKKKRKMKERKDARKRRQKQKNDDNTNSNINTDKQIQKYKQNKDNRHYTYTYTQQQLLITEQIFQELQLSRQIPLYLPPYSPLFTREIIIQVGKQFIKQQQQSSLYSINSLFNLLNTFSSLLYESFSISFILLLNFLPKSYRKQRVNKINQEKEGEKKDDQQTSDEQKDLTFTQQQENQSQIIPHSSSPLSQASSQSYFSSKLSSLAHLLHHKAFEFLIPQQQLEKMKQKNKKERKRENIEKLKEEDQTGFEIEDEEDEDEEENEEIDEQNLKEKNQSLNKDVNEKENDNKNQQIHQSQQQSQQQQLQQDEQPRFSQFLPIFTQSIRSSIIPSLLFQFSLQSLSSITSQYITNMISKLCDNITRLQLYKSSEYYLILNEDILINNNENEQQQQTSQPSSQQSLLTNQLSLSSLSSSLSLLSIPIKVAQYIGMNILWHLCVQEQQQEKEQQLKEKPEDSEDNKHSQIFILSQSIPQQSSTSNLTLNLSQNILSFFSSQSLQPKSALLGWLIVFAHSELHLQELIDEYNNKQRLIKHQEQETQSVSSVTTSSSSYYSPQYYLQQCLQNAIILIPVDEDYYEDNNIEDDKQSKQQQSFAPYTSHNHTFLRIPLYSYLLSLIFTPQNVDQLEKFSVFVQKTQIERDLIIQQKQQRQQRKGIDDEDDDEEEEEQNVQEQEQADEQNEDQKNQFEQETKSKVNNDSESYSSYHSKQSLKSNWSNQTNKTSNSNKDSKNQQSVNSNVMNKYSLYSGPYGYTQLSPLWNLSLSQSLDYIEFNYNLLKRKVEREKEKEKEKEQKNQNLKQFFSISPQIWFDKITESISTKYAMKQSSFEPFITSSSIVSQTFQYFDSVKQLVMNELKRLRKGKEQERLNEKRKNKAKLKQQQNLQSPESDDDYEQDEDEEENDINDDEEDENETILKNRDDKIQSELLVLLSCFALQYNSEGFKDFIYRNNDNANRKQRNNNRKNNLNDVEYNEQKEGDLNEDSDSEEYEIKGGKIKAKKKSTNKDNNKNSQTSNEINQSQSQYTNINFYLPSEVNKPKIESIIEGLISPSLILRDFTETVATFSSPSSSSFDEFNQPTSSQSSSQSSSFPTANDNVQMTLQHSLSRELTMNISAPQDSSIRVEIVFKLSGLHPLRSPQCQFIRREGIPQPVSRRWEMLAASMMNQSGKVSSVSGSIGGQNTGIGSGLSTGASLASAASVLVANVQEFFSRNREPCLICYSVIEITTHEMPKAQCNGCQKKFHSSCLQKWFHSSKKTTCPHCSRPFYV